MYSDSEGASFTFMSEQQTNMCMNDRVGQEFRTFRTSVNSIGKVTNILGWYQERQLQFTILAWFSTLIFDIPPSQAENEIGFSIVRVFTGARRVRMLVDMLSKLIFNNMNSIGIQPNQTTDIFRNQLGI